MIVILQTKVVLTKLTVVEEMIVIEQNLRLVEITKLTVVEEMIVIL